MLLIINNSIKIIDRLIKTHYTGNYSTGGDGMSQSKHLYRGIESAKNENIGKMKWGGGDIIIMASFITLSLVKNHF